MNKTDRLALIRELYARRFESRTPPLLELVQLPEVEVAAVIETYKATKEWDREDS